MRNGNILVIEDEQDLAEAIREKLTTEGFSVRLALSGEDGIRMLQEERPDLILLDSVLSGISGIAVLEEIKEIREKENLPVIMLSNLDDAEDIKKARTYNIEEYLIKTDWRLDEIAKKIKKILRNL